MNATLANQDIARNLYGYGKVHQPLQGPWEFGEEHLEQYRQLGFVAIENVFTPEQVDGAKGELQRLIEANDPGGALLNFEPGIDIDALPLAQRHQYVRKLMFFLKHSALLNAMAHDATLLGIVERLVGEEVQLTQDMALLKPAHVGTEKPWHQDSAYFLLEPREKIIGTWTALDPATAENGCMHLLPGSQLEGPRPHYHARDCQLPDDEGRAAHDVMVPLQPGGVLFFSSMVHHGTPPNNSPASRWALQFHYASVRCRPIDTDAHALAFRDHAGYAGCLR